MSIYDPYHKCEKWNLCCENNLTLLRKNPSYKRFTKKYGKYSKTLNFTYSDWIWYMECFFEDLPHPNDMFPTDCGVCFVCVYGSGTYECICHQPLNTYKDWYNEKLKLWVLETNSAK